MKRKFCEIIKEPKNLPKFRRVEFFYNCRGDLYIYEDGKIIGIERKKK